MQVIHIALCPRGLLYLKFDIILVNGYMGINNKNNVLIFGMILYKTKNTACYTSTDAGTPVNTLSICAWFRVRPFKGETQTTYSVNVKPDDLKNQQLFSKF